MPNFERPDYLAKAITFLIITLLFLVFWFFWQSQWIIDSGEDSSPLSVASQLKMKMKFLYEKRDKEIYETLGISDPALASQRSNLYYDKNFNFILFFPDSWKDYTATEMLNGQKGGFKYHGTFFGLPECKVIFGIYAYTKKDWKFMKSAKIDAGPELGESLTYVFTYKIFDQTGDINLEKRAGEAQQIIASFKLKY